MARTLHIIEDAVTKGLGQTILDAMMKEAKAIFAFASKFNVVMTAPNKLPAAVDFTDSIVKVVAKDDAVDPTKSEVEQQQIRSIEASIKQHNLNIQLAQARRTPATPEKGGIGWHGKEVLRSGRARAAICQTGGIASCQTVKETVLIQFAPNNWTLEDAKRSTDGTRRAAATAHGDQRAQMEKQADETYAKSEKHWTLSGTAFASWPKNMQEALGIVLARLIAHEARHQYVVDHFAAGGLGGESAELFGVKSSEKFLGDDEKVINARLKALEDLQKTATIHLETFPNGQGFAFYNTGRVAGIPA
jgi:hypothetical protein